VGDVERPPHATWDDSAWDDPAWDDRAWDDIDAAANEMQAA